MAVPEDNWSFWVVCFELLTANLIAKFWGSTQAHWQSLVGVSDRQAQTYFWIGGSDWICSWQKQASFRKRCHHLCDMDLVLASNISLHILGSENRFFFFFGGGGGLEWNFDGLCKKLVTDQTWYRVKQCSHCFTQSFYCLFISEQK